MWNELVPESEGSGDEEAAGERSRSRGPSWRGLSIAISVSLLVGCVLLVVVTKAVGWNGPVGTSVTDMAQEVETLAAAKSYGGPKPCGSMCKFAYRFFIPLALMEQTRADSEKLYGPSYSNSFLHMRTVPDYTFKTVVRPNLDTLYSQAWLDLEQGPIVLSVPSIPVERFYMFQIMDLWSNTFMSLGTRHVGDSPGTYLIYHNLKDKPSDGDTTFTNTSRSLTRYVWVLGRTTVLPGEDLSNVYWYQDQYNLSSLNTFLKNGPPNKVLDSANDTSNPAAEVDAMSAEVFFTNCAGVMANGNPPSPDDDPEANANIKALGISVGTPLDWDSLTIQQKSQMTLSKKMGIAAYAKEASELQQVANCWSGLPNTIGDFGTDYTTRAVAAQVGLGANIPEDAVYKVGLTLDGTVPLKLTFTSESPIPPVRAFWSATLYNTDGNLVQNPIGRYKLGSNDGIEPVDGKLSLYLQANEPSSENMKYWLPTPSSKDTKCYTLTVRMYWGKEAILDNSYVLPEITMADGSALAGSAVCQSGGDPNDCRANPESNQEVTDADCAKCIDGQEWWPCQYIGSDGQPTCLGNAGTCVPGCYK